MYLVIKDDNNNKKSYQVTDAFNKPYMKVSNSILPLTLNTTNGLQLKLGDSEHATTGTVQTTVRTSSINNIGMSNSSALTTTVSYDTSALTESTTQSYISSYGTEALTRASTSGS